MEFLNDFGLLFVMSVVKLSLGLVFVVMVVGLGCEWSVLMKVFAAAFRDAFVFVVVDGWEILFGVVVLLVNMENILLNVLSLLDYGNGWCDGVGFVGGGSRGGEFGVGVDGVDGFVAFVNVFVFVFEL